MNLSAIFKKFPHTAHNLSNAGKLGIISAGFQKGQPKLGVDQGPKIVKEQGLIQKMTDLGYQVTDYPELKFDTVENDTPDGNVKFPETTANANLQIAEAVYNSLKKDKNDKTIVIGGDHSIAIGSIYGHSKFVQEKYQEEENDNYPINNFCCLWVDAHADINTANSSYSGNIHGQCLSYLLKSPILKNYVREVRGFDKWLKQRSLLPERLAYIGLRDIDEQETKLLEELGITYSSMYEVEKYGINFCIEKALDKINPTGKRNTHVSFDIDALDPAVAPSTGTPVFGGLSLSQAMFIGERVNDIGVNVTCMDIVEVNPELSDFHPEVDPKVTARSANLVVESFMGRDRGGQYRPGARVPLKEDV